MIAAWARDYIGIPFQYRGREHSGCDCYGLVELVLSEVFDVAVRDFDYASDVDETTVADLFEEGLREAEWQRVIEPRPGDVVLLRIEGHPVHCGIVVGDGRMLHTMEGVNSHIERIDGERWFDRVYGYYRHDHMHS